MLQLRFLEDQRYGSFLDNLYKLIGPEFYVVGGRVSRELANMLYLTPVGENCDLDIIVQNLSDLDCISKKYTHTRNSFGGLKLKLDNDSGVDIWSLEPNYASIEDYLDSCSLNIQSIAFSFYSGKFIGNLGIGAVMNRKVKINNPERLRTYCKLKGLSILDYVDSKSRY